MSEPMRLTVEALGHWILGWTLIVLGVAVWIRAAVLQTSPIAVYSSRRSLPTLPEMNGPLLMPIPIRKPSP